MTAVLSFVSPASGTGKTTLMEAVVAELKKRGYRVGAVKHSTHRIEMDREGSDSWRFSRAGCDASVVVAPGTLAIIRRVEEPSIEEVLEEASRGMDIVLVEGYKEMPLPRILLYRDGYSAPFEETRTGTHDPFLLAVASDVPLKLDCPVLDLNAPEKVADFIETHLLEES